MAPQMRTEALTRTRESTRARILAAAADLFSRAGYEATTVKDIARECQLTDPALYYHFGSKRDILTALLVEPPLEDLVLESQSHPTRDTLADDLCRLVDLWSTHPDVLRLVFRHALEGDEGLREFRRGLSETYERLLLPPLRQIYGTAAERIYTVVGTLLAGIQLDALITHGDHYGAAVATPEYRARLRELLGAALPPTEFASEAL